MAAHDLPSKGFAHDLPSTGFVRLPTVLSLIPLSRSTVFSRVAAGEFPTPVSLGPRVRAWRVEELRAFIEDPAGWVEANKLAAVVSEAKLRGGAVHPPRPTSFTKRKEAEVPT